MKQPLAWVVILLVSVAPAHGQTNQNEELLSRVRTLEEQVRALQAQLDELRQGMKPDGPRPEGAAAPGPSTFPEAPPPMTGPMPATHGVEPVQSPAQGGPPLGLRALNPDIGIIGNFVGAGGLSRGGSEAFAPLPSVTLQESEASFQAIVDPYARADFFLAVGEEGIEVEEGYVTFTALPGDLLVKAGRMRANFGRLNAFHNHTLPWVDRPLVMFNLLGGEATGPDTGIKDAGVSISRLIPAGNLFVEATGEIYRGDSGTLFASSRRADLSVVTHLRTYADITEDANVEVGAPADGSPAGGSTSPGALGTPRFGTVATRPCSRSGRASSRRFAGSTAEPGSAMTCGWPTSCSFRCCSRLARTAPTRSSRLRIGSSRRGDSTCWLAWAGRTWMNPR